jgi:hypothetical protein
MAMTLEQLMHSDFQKEIAEGKHRAKLLSTAYVPNAKNRNNDYITMNFAIDADCTYRRNMFVRDVSIMLSHVRRQLGRQDETIQPPAFLQGLIDNKTEFDMWFSYPTVLTKSGPARTQNIRFIAPAELPASTEATTDDSAALEEINGALVG